MLDGELPPGFERRVVLMRAGERQMYQSCEWRDAIVAIDSGEIQLECEGQVPCRFRRGDLLSLGGLGLTSIYNAGPEPAVLIAVCRRPQRRTQETT